MPLCFIQNGISNLLIITMQEQVNIVNKSDNALPAYASPGDAGMDLRANISHQWLVSEGFADPVDRSDLTEDLILKPLQRAIVPTGIYIQLPKGHEAQIRPRSGLAAKHGISIVNSPGTIDSQYRGEIKVILVNLSNDNVTIKHGDRICQMVIAKYENISLTEVNELTDETERGTGGFGHTGIK